MEKPRIVFCYITPFHPNKGGIGRVTHVLTLELQKRGYDVFYLIYPVTQRHEYDYPAPLEYLPSKELLSEVNVHYFFEYIVRNRIDIVINQSGNFSDSQLWLKAKEKGVKVISVLHTYPTTSYKHLWECDVFPLRNDTFIEKAKRIVRCLLYLKIKNHYRQSTLSEFRHMLPRTDIMVTLSKKQYDEINNWCPGYLYKYRTIPNPNAYGVDYFDVSCKKNIILYVGLFSSVKREDRIVKVWRKIYKEYPDWELVIVGYGNELRRKYLRNLAKGIKNIRFTGYQSPLKWQQRAKIACMTSISEGWGMVLTEAMQCGAVPVAFNSFASVTDIITDGRNGLLVKPFSLKEYEQKLKYLLDHPDVLNEMSTHAAEDIKRYSVENVVDQWEELFNELRNNI